jgi:hypothetical protein
VSPDVYIGVDQVASELGLTKRQAWELVRKLAVPCLGPTRNMMDRARFRRADYETRLAQSLSPPEARKSPKSATAEEPGETRRRARKIRAAELEADIKSRIGGWRAAVPIEPTE